MTTLNTPLTSLALAASQWPKAAVFKTPIIDDHKNPIAPHIIGYNTITYTEFHNYVETSARYWYAKLSEDGIPMGSVVGYCSRGGSYIDFVHIYGLSKVGYVPQLFTALPQSIEVIKTLLEKSKAKALLYQEGHFHSARTLAGPDLKVYPIFIDLPTTQASGALPDLPEPQPTDIYCVLHSSGSTSGMPKLVPYTFRFTETLLRKADAIASTHPSSVRSSPDVISWVGSACHVSGFSLLIEVMRTGSCIIQQTCIPPGADELKSMFNLGGLTRVFFSTPSLSRFLKASRTDPQLLDLLKTSKAISHGGAAILSDDLKWARLNRLNLVDGYGSTECGVYVMRSGPSQVGTPEHAYLRPLQLLEEDGRPLTRYWFAPVTKIDGNVVLKEFVVLQGSADLPHPSLLGGQEDFHTGDLFEEVKPGEYIHRGRVDDWIQMANASNCDARSIEDDAKALCRDLELFSDCIAAGSNQPSPVLIVEASVADTDEEKRLKQDIFKCIVDSDSHKKRFPHEQIASADAIIIVPPGSMTRTVSKGNIRRKAVEDALGDRIRAVFS
ncbi:hypothetical protein V5O48_010375 [Marasmius crinis-equi]|uniref:AMP-dependent synthetase/ligase domain-containing protein n=1 Tax=Marasmius crinis-equi TaxID=585013 RepID=A0ABR3F8K5_9AGAR